MTAGEAAEKAATAAKPPIPMPPLPPLLHSPPPPQHCPPDAAADAGFPCSPQTGRPQQAKQAGGWVCSRRVGGWAHLNAGVGAGGQASAFECRQAGGLSQRGGTWQGKGMSSEWQANLAWLNVVQAMNFRCSGAI